MDNDDFEDPLFEQAIDFVARGQKASISGIQRQFKIGYNRACRIVDEMEIAGVISKPGAEGNGCVLLKGSFEDEMMQSYKNEKLRRRVKELSNQLEVATSIDEQLRISAITNRKIVIWLKDTGSFLPSGDKVLMLSSSSPFEYLAKQQKSKIKPGDSEYSDILDGYRFSATMQMRTPTSVLCQHGRIEKVPAHKLPRLVNQDWQGAWLPRIRPASELGDWARDVKGGMASEVGTIPSDGGDYLRFLLFMHQIVEDDISDSERIKWLESCYSMVGSDGEPLDTFIKNYGECPEVALRVITNSVKKG